MHTFTLLFLIALAGSLALRFWLASRQLLHVRKYRDSVPDSFAGKVPLKEAQSYHSRLKSLTGGDGSYTMEFSHYAEVPKEFLDLGEAKSA